MAKTKEKSLNYDTSQNSLMICHLLDVIVKLFVSTFLVAHIYSFNGNTYEYLLNVGIYNMCHYLAMMLFYNPISKVVDRTNRIGAYRFSLVLKSILVIIIIFFGKELSKLLVLAGLMYGTANAFYYASYNVIKQEMVSRRNMNNFVANNNILTKLIDIVCPVILGLLIDITTYSMVAILVLAICVVQVIFSLRIKSKRPENSGFDMKGFFKKIKEHPIAFKKAKIVYLLCILYSSFALTSTIINVCIMLETGSSFSLGALTSIFAVLSIITLIIIKKFTKPAKRLWLFILSSILPIFAGIYFIIDMNAISIIILNGAISITSTIKTYLLDLYRNGILKDAGLYSEISEHQAMSEFCLNISRTLAFGLLMIVALFRSIIVFKVFAIITIVVGSVVYLILHYYEKTYHNDDSLLCGKTLEESNEIKSE